MDEITKDEAWQRVVDAVDDADEACQISIAARLLENVERKRQEKQEIAEA